MALNVTIAPVLSLTAVSWATFSCRIITTAPLALLGTAVANPASTARAAFSASKGV